MATFHRRHGRRAVPDLHGGRSMPRRMGRGPAIYVFVAPQEDVDGRPEPVLGRAFCPTRGPTMTEAGSFRGLRMFLRSRDLATHPPHVLDLALEIHVVRQLEMLDEP